MDIRQCIENFISFLRTKKVWLRPKRRKVLIFDRNGSETFLSYIDPKNVEILDVRGESVNIYVLISYFLSKISKKNFGYLDQYIRIVDPMVVITFIDNNPYFYSIKRKNPNIKTIFIQNGIRGKYDDIFEILEKNANNKETYLVDYMLTLGSAIGNEYKKHIRGQVIPIGSFKNNLCQYQEKVNARSVLFVSEYRHPPISNNIPMLTNGIRSFNWDEVYAAERYLLPILGKYCRSNKLDLKICGRYSDYRGEEYLFYESILGKSGWEFIPKSDTFNSYKHINESEFIVSMQSTLGYEALARGKKTVVLAIRGSILRRTDCDFGWPAILPNRGPFWTNLLEESEVNRLMDYITTVSDEEWDRTRKSYVNEIVEYDPGNTLFIKLMKELGVPLDEEYQNADFSFSSPDNQILKQKENHYGTKNSDPCRLWKNRDNLATKGNFPTT